MADATMPTTRPVLGPAEHLFQLAFGYVISSALYVAVKLKIADHIIRGAATTAELARETGVNEDALYRVLRALASAGVFEETSARRFGMTPTAELLREDVPSARDVVLWISDPFHHRVYAEMMHSAETGKPAAEKVCGVPVFDHFARDRELSEIFNNAMTTFSAMVIPAVLDVYDFSDVETLVDVAGGHGHVLTAILQKYPHMRGVLFDLDHVVAGAGPKIAQAGVAERCRTEAGDMFQAVSRGGDAYIMKHIIHDWDDNRAATILRNIHTALEGKPHGKVILLEAVITPGNEPDLAKLVDVEMLLLPGGRERTADEFAALFAHSGFELTRIIPNASPLSVIEARVK